MSRDQRMRDNWALLHALEEAGKRSAPAAVAFNLVGLLHGLVWACMAWALVPRMACTIVLRRRRGSRGPCGAPCGVVRAMKGQQRPRRRRRAVRTSTATRVKTPASNELQVPEFLGAGARQFVFMLKGLRELAPRLEAHGIPFFLLRASRLGGRGCGGCGGFGACGKRLPPAVRLRCLRQRQLCRKLLARARVSWPRPLAAQPRPQPPQRLGQNDSPMLAPCSHSCPQGDPAVTVPKLVRDTGAGLLVTDYSPLRLGRQWRDQVRKGAPGSTYEHLGGRAGGRAAWLLQPGLPWLRAAAAPRSPPPAPLATSNPSPPQPPHSPSPT
jgi:hypothetical protein